jgi:hypothetical protein
MKPWLRQRAHFGSRETWNYKCICFIMTWDLKMNLFVPFQRSNYFQTFHPWFSWTGESYSHHCCCSEAFFSRKWWTLHGRSCHLQSAQTRPHSTASLVALFALLGEMEIPIDFTINFQCLLPVIWFSNYLLRIRGHWRRVPVRHVRWPRPYAVICDCLRIRRLFVGSYWGLHFHLFSFTIS